MAKITRTTQKIFASNAGAQGITEYGSPATGTPAYTTSVADAQSLQAWLDGWSAAALAGSEIPTFQDFNAIHFTTTSQLAYLLQEGIAEYDAATEYHTNSIVKKAGTYELYGSKTNTNTGNALPSQTDNTNWQYLGTLQDLASVVKNNYTASTDPDSDNDVTEGYAVGSEWVNTTSDESFKCVDATDGAAVWVSTSSSAPNIVTVQDSASARQTSSSATYVGVSGGTIAITPSSASSKVKVSFQFAIIAQAISGALVRIKRGATVIGTYNAANHLASVAGYPSGGNNTFTIVDSPSTTSEVTYTVEFARGSEQPNGNPGTSNVVVLEAPLSARQYIAEEILA